jgi:hypothetical protein
MSAMVGLSTVQAVTNNAPKSYERTTTSFTQKIVASNATEDGISTSNNEKCSTPKKRGAKPTFTEMESKNDNTVETNASSPTAESNVTTATSEISNEVNK